MSEHSSTHICVICVITSAFLLTFPLKFLTRSDFPISCPSACTHVPFTHGNATVQILYSARDTKISCAQWFKDPLSIEALRVVKHNCAYTHSAYQPVSIFTFPFNKRSGLTEMPKFYRRATLSGGSVTYIAGKIPRIYSKDVIRVVESYSLLLTL